MKTLIIMRGPSGSGKSTLIAELEKDYGVTASVCSADNYWYFGKEKTPENYKFDFSKLGASHAYCYSECEKAIASNNELIVIDNTNINLRDFKDYIELGTNAEYEVILHSIVGITPEDSFRLNVHKVPLEVCIRMVKNFQKCPNNVQIKDKFVKVTEVVHDYLQIRKGVFGNGKFGKENKKKS